MNKLVPKIVSEFDFKSKVMYQNQIRTRFGPKTGLLGAHNWQKQETAKELNLKKSTPSWVDCE